MKSFNKYYLREKQLINPEYEYYYLKNGISHGPFKSRDNIPKSVSSIEKVWVNEKEYNEAKKEVNDEYNNAINKWYKDLREEWKELSDVTFGLCYNFSYEKHHSYGFDEISNGLYDIIHFAQEIISANKEK